MSDRTSNPVYKERWVPESRELLVSPAQFAWYQEAAHTSPGWLDGWMCENYLPRCGPGEIKLVVRWDWQ